MLPHNPPLRNPLVQDKEISLHITPLAYIGGQSALATNFSHTCTFIIYYIPAEIREKDA